MEAQGQLKQAHKTPLVLSIYPDEDVESPETWNEWKVYSFSRYHYNYRHPSEFDNIGFRTKLKTGTAFTLDYFEHGVSTWTLTGHDQPGMEFQWDGVRRAGVLVWTGKRSALPKTMEERKKSAEAFLETYNSWANGWVYGYNLDDAEGNLVDSCYGFFANDEDYFVSTIKEAIDGRPYIISEGKHIIEYTELARNADN